MKTNTLNPIVPMFARLVARKGKSLMHSFLALLLLIGVLAPNFATAAQKVGEYHTIKSYWALKEKPNLTTVAYLSIYWSVTKGYGIQERNRVRAQYDSMKIRWKLKSASIIKKSPVYR